MYPRSWPSTFILYSLRNALWVASSLRTNRKGTAVHRLTLTTTVLHRILPLENGDHFSLSGKLPTYPSPKPSFCIKGVHINLVGFSIECFHSRGQHICKFIGTKESVCIKKELNFQRTGLGYQHGRRFIVLGHQYGRRDVM